VIELDGFSVRVFGSLLGQGRARQPFMNVTDLDYPVVGMQAVSNACGEWLGHSLRDEPQVANETLEHLVTRFLACAEDG
jgi:hypothetical protein